MIPYIRLKLHGASVRALLWKLSISALFIFTALSCLAAHGTSADYGCLIAAGLVFGLIGDALLDLKYIYPTDNDAYTFSGFAVFALGHVCYLAALYLRFQPASLSLALLLAAAFGIGVLIGFPGEKLAHLKYGRFRWVIVGYMTFLFWMLFVTVFLNIRTGFAEPSLLFMLPGAILFTVSDLILGNTYYGTGKDGPAYIISNYLTYYPAQFLIALSIL